MFKLKDITAYSTSYTLSNRIWEVVGTWKYLPQKTVGDQWIRSTDSISANIAEGFGRHHKKDRVKFYYNARTSVYESAHWCHIAHDRELISTNQNEEIMEQLRILPREINTLIKLTMKNLKE